jgi:hypothetical protein
MTRTQIQLPDALYARAKRIARQHEISLAELVRRGLEHMIELYPDEKSEDRWELPSPRSLGDFSAPPEDWRELANLSEP